MVILVWLLALAVIWMVARALLWHRVGGTLALNALLMVLLGLGATGVAVWMLAS